MKTTVRNFTKAMAVLAFVVITFCCLSLSSFATSEEETAGTTTASSSEAIVYNGKIKKLDTNCKHVWEDYTEDTYSGQKCSACETVRDIPVATYDLSVSNESNIAADVYSNLENNSYYKGYILVIYGEGKMPQLEGRFPWYTDYSSTLRTVYISEGITTVGSSAFSYCNKLADISLPSTLTHIGQFAFNYCTSLNSIQLPSNVTYIDYYAFNNCTALGQITISQNATYIDNTAFLGCSNLKEITVDSNNQNYKSIDGNLYNNDVTELIKYAVGKKAEEFTVPESVHTINAHAFNGCKNIKKIMLPNNVVTINEYAFRSCNNLVSIIIPDSVKTIGESAFANCSSLTDINIPAALSAINDYTFADCTSLEAILIPDNITSIGGRAFNFCTNLKNVTIPNTLTTIADGTFYGCSSLESIKLPDALETIDRYAFSNCSALASITIPDSVTSIGEGAFHSCTSLISIQISSKVNIIENDLFNRCYNLEEVILHDKITKIKNYAFMYCESLVNIVVYATVIDYHAFQYCKNLNCVIVGDNVTSTENAFTECKNLKNVIINSVELAKSLTGTYVCANNASLIKYAENIAIRADITEIGSYVLNNFIHVTPVTYDGVEYNVYSKAELGYKISSAYLQLTDDINVVYRTQIPEGYTDPYMEFVMNGVTYTVTDFTLDTEGRYCFGFMDIAPHKMSENISATVYANWNGMKVGVCKAEYSVKEYFEYILTAYEDNADMVTMVSDLLIYGEKAQIFAGNSSDLVTDGLEDKLSGSEFIELDESANKLGLNGEASENAKWASAALRLENEMAVKLGFVASDIEGLTVEVTINGRTTVYDVSELTLTENGRYYIFFRGIMAYEFDDEITAVFMQNGVQIGQTLTYSVNSYIYNSQSSDVETLADLVKSIYNYGASAKKYKGN